MPLRLRGAPEKWADRGPLPHENTVTPSGRAPRASKRPIIRGSLTWLRHFKSSGRIVIVGASLAGLRAALLIAQGRSCTTDSIFVAGDVARFPHVLYEYQFLTLEHWDNAVLGAEVAAHNMVSLEPDRWPHLPLPAFWSGQFGVNIKSVGVCPFGTEIVFTQGSIKERRFAAAYGRRGRIVAAVTFNHGKWLEYYAAQIERSAPFPPPRHLVTTGPGKRNRSRPNSRIRVSRPRFPMSF
jgi:hypothetical protein